MTELTLPTNSEPRDEISSVIAKFLMQIRKSKKLSQADTANLAAISVRHYQDLEYGLRKCRIDTLSKILAIHKLNLFNFFEEYLISEFYQNGISELSLALNSLPFTIIQFNASGEITGQEKQNLAPGNKIWDLIVNSSEKAFIQGLLPLLLKEKPYPFPWSGQVIDSQGKPVKVKCYWRYVRSSPECIDGFEVISFKESLHFKH